MQQHQADNRTPEYLKQAERAYHRAIEGLIRVKEIWKCVYHVNGEGYFHHTFSQWDPKAHRRVEVEKRLPVSVLEDWRKRSEIEVGLTEGRLREARECAKEWGTKTLSIWEQKGGEA